MMTSSSPEPLQELVDPLALGDDHYHDHQIIVAYLIDDAVLASDGANVYAPVGGVLAMQLLAPGRPGLFGEGIYSVLHALAGLALGDLVDGLAGAALDADSV